MSMTVAGSAVATNKREAVHTIKRFAIPAFAKKATAILGTEETHFFIFRPPSQAAVFR